MKDTPQKFYLYARKSTDEAQRQVLSIEAQLHELREFARKENLHIVREFVESKTAKEPGREVFNEMLASVENGDVEGIVAWHADRLARNSVDGGKIIYLLDVGKLKYLKFPTLWFENTPQGKFMLNIAFGQSKYYVDNLSENIRRGIRQKLRNGVWPGYAPIGYLNDKTNRTIVPDTDKATLIRKAFELYATGEYPLLKLRKVINESGLVGKRDKLLSISNYQYLLKNPIYYGAIRYGGELYDGVHEPIITKKLFDAVQSIMGSKSRTTRAPKLKPYSYRGVFRCGECDCMITTETQKGHNYLRCTKRRGVCTQPYVREEAIAEQVREEVQKVSLPSAWVDACVQILEKERTHHQHAERSSVQKLESEITTIEKKLDALLDLQLDGSITHTEYTNKKQVLLNRKTDLKEQIAVFERTSDNRFEPLTRFLKSLNQAGKITSRGNLEENRDFLKKIGSNPSISARTLCVPRRSPFALAATWHAAACAAAASGSVSVDCPKVRRVRDSNP